MYTYPQLFSVCKKFPLQLANNLHYNTKFSLHISIHSRTIKQDHLRILSCTCICNTKPNQNQSVKKGLHIASFMAVLITNAVQNNHSLQEILFIDITIKHSNM